MPKLDLPKKYLAPKLMVLGDSLAQGCRSLTVTKDLCAQSYGARLAKSQGWSHYSPPQHPQPVVADVEEIIRQSDDLLTYFKIAKKIDRNITAWRDLFAKTKAPTGTPPCWDNVAIAGCNTAEFRDMTARKWRNLFREKDAEYQAAEGFDRFGVAASMHFPINGCYTLNPTGDAAFDDVTQMQWAFARQPEHLIMHFGHNDGLYPVGGEGKVTRLLDNKEAYLEVIKEVLAAPKGIKHIVLILLPKVSSVANLQPEGKLLPNSTYYQSYETQFPFRSASISGKDLAEMDRQIKEINGAARMLAADAMNDRRITLVDTYQIFSKFDYKNTLSPDSQVRIGSTVVDNRYLEGRLLPQPPALPKTQLKYTYKHGGFQSIDGMHPSAVGYAVFADQVALQMGLPRLSPKDFEVALEDEKLIKKFPAPLPGFRNLLDLAKGIVGLLGNGEETDLKMPKAGPVVVGLLSRCFERK